MVLIPHFYPIFFDNKNQGVIGNGDLKPVDLNCMLTLNKTELERSRIENLKLNHEQILES